jgi:D-alanyl-D-alanine carboxypeptidase
MSQIDRAAAATMNQGSPGMIVAIGKRGRQPIIRPYGTADIEQAAPVKAQSVFRIASVTKQFTAAAVLALAETGELSIDDPLVRHLPDFSVSRDITLRHLLLHTSGIADYARDEPGQVTRTIPHSLTQMLVWIGDLAKDPRFSPGTRWEYSNSNYVLLGAVVERVTGKPLGEVFKTRLFDKAKLRDTAFDVEADVVSHRVRGYKKLPGSPTRFANADPIDHSVPGAAGGLRSSVTDLLRWTDALFAGEVIDARSVRRMTTPGQLDDGRTTRFGMPPAWQAGLNADYAMGVFVSRTPHGERIWHDGAIDGFGTWLAHYPHHGITIALMQNSESADFDKVGIEAAVFAAQGDGCL